MLHRMLKQIAANCFISLLYVLDKPTKRISRLVKIRVSCMIAIDAV